MKRVCGTYILLDDSTNTTSYPCTVSVEQAKEPLGLEKVSLEQYYRVSKLQLVSI